MAKGAHSKTPTATKRPERMSHLRAQYEANKKIILATQSICGICGKPVDKSIKYPDPMSPTIDHIIPVSQNGDPISLDNLQLAHRCCNRRKSDKMPNFESKVVEQNRNLPLSANWRTD
jgi:5-methylcytosine-specific restriction endonuclease McrA